MINKKQWSKTVLTSYNYLQRLCDTIDKIVERTALNSHYICGSWDSNCSVEAVSKKIIKLINKKIEYINLKVAIDKSLEKMNVKHAKLLVLRYIHYFSQEKVCEILNISLRTFYTLLDKAINSFSNIMSSIGYSAPKLEVTFAMDGFINSIYEQIQKYKYVEASRTETLSYKKVLADCFDEFYAHAF